MRSTASIKASKQALNPLTLQPVTAHLHTSSFTNIGTSQPARVTALRCAGRHPESGGYTRLPVPGLQAGAWAWPLVIECWQGVRIMYHTFGRWSRTSLPQYGVMPCKACSLAGNVAGHLPHSFNILPDGQTRVDHWRGAAAHHQMWMSGVLAKILPQDLQDTFTQRQIRGQRGHSMPFRFTQCRFDPSQDLWDDCTSPRCAFHNHAVATLDIAFATTFSLQRHLSLPHRHLQQAPYLPEKEQQRSSMYGACNPADSPLDASFAQRLSAK